MHQFIRSTLETAQTRFVTDALRRISIGASWRIAATVAAQVSRLATGVILARLLGPEEFGKLAVLQNTVGLFATVASLGLGSTLVKHVAQYRSSDRERAGRLIGLGLFSAVFSGGLMFAVAALLAPVLAARALGSSDLLNPLRIMACTLVTGTLDNTQSGALIGLESFATVTRLAIFRSTLTALGMISGALYGGLLFSLIGALAADILYIAFTTRLLYQQCRRFGIVITVKGARSDWPVLVNFSLPLLLTSIVNWIAQWFTVTLFARQIDGYGNLAIFQAARQWTTPISLVSGALGEASFPIMANQLGNGDMAGFKSTLRTNLLVSCSSAVALGIVINVFSSRLMSMYGRDFTGGAYIVLILSIGLVLNAINTTFNQVIATSGRIWSGLGFTLGFATVLVGSCLGLVSLGAAGLAWSFTAAYVAHTLIQGVFAATVVRRTLRERSQFSQRPSEPVCSISSA